MSLEIVLIAVLLNAPADAVKPISPTTHVFVEVIAPAVFAVALNAELFDPRECRSSLYSGIDLYNMLHERWREAQQLPSLSDFPRPPDGIILQKLRAINRTYRGELTDRVAIDWIYADAIQAAICDTDAIYQVLSEIADAIHPYYYVSVRRRSWANVRRLMGDEAFYAGWLPPPVPLQHIPRK